MRNLDAGNDEGEREQNGSPGRQKEKLRDFSNMEETDDSCPLHSFSSFDLHLGPSYSLFSLCIFL